MVRPHLFAVYQMRCEYVNVVSFGGRGFRRSWFLSRWLRSPTPTTNRSYKESENNKQANENNSLAHGISSALVDSVGPGILQDGKLAKTWMVVNKNPFRPSFRVADHSSRMLERLPGIA